MNGCIHERDFFGGSFFIKSEPGTRDDLNSAKNGRHFSPFPERGHTDFSLFTSKSVCPRNSPNGSYGGQASEADGFMFFCIGKKPEALTYPHSRSEHFMTERQHSRFILRSGSGAMLRRPAEK